MHIVSLRRQFAWNVKTIFWRKKKKKKKKKKKEKYHKFVVVCCICPENGTSWYKQYHLDYCANRDFFSFIYFNKIFQIFNLTFKWSITVTVNCSVRKRTFRTCAPSEDQHVHSRNLIRIFAGRFLDSIRCKRSSCANQSLWQDCMNAQADLSLR